MQENNNMDVRHYKPIRIAFLLLLIVISISLIKGWFGSGMHGQDTANVPSISVSGTGQSYAAPDVATISFSVDKEASTVANAQQQVNTIISQVKTGLEGKGVADQDIQTTDYNSYPVYENQATPAIVCNGQYCPPVSQNQVLKGYEVDQTIEVKIRNIDSSGDILTYIGTEGVTNISQLAFSVDDPTSAQADARSKAITDAKTKAQALATELGVHLVRITSFSEDTNTPYPLYRATAAGANTLSAPAPVEVPAGENQFTSNVTITYEIK